MLTSGLRGRGRGRFFRRHEVELRESQVWQADLFLCNADESEPGTFKDRQIIYKDPHQLIEGMVIACYANDVNLAYIYIRGEFPEGAKI